MGGTVVDDSDDARAAVLPAVPASSNLPLLIEWPWSGELMNHTAAWGGNLLRRVKRGRWSSELPYSYPAGSVGHPTGLYAEELLFGSHQKSGGGGDWGSDGRMGDIAKDLTAGTVGGIANLVVGHPFDTIKVKLQSQPSPAPGQLPKYAGAFDAVKQTVAAEGPRGLYKGMGAPLATVAAFNALLFTVRGQMETLLRSEPGAPLTAQSSLAEAGAVSGVALPKGPMDVARHVMRDAGVKGLFKGIVPTMGREIPGNAIMFGVYEAVKQYMAGGRDTSGLGQGSLILAGGLAGGALWLTVYPTDVVKSVIQVDDCKKQSVIQVDDCKKPRYSGSIDALKKIVAADGVKGLYKGFGPAMARSVPANAATFVAYEITRSAMG
ncbi:hypothetical protein TRIUR3_24130 [Triticum urartu]|uniref:Mitochondrial carnitine/acylcarnitine carrier-like protein n=1 Tax=Triticum urartu TaxID=4572 RepID=M7ZNV6_TRIUA|nr:hypothetical protein TRIUR3_24130 [Triticum urartu]